MGKLEHIDQITNLEGCPFRTLGLGERRHGNEPPSRHPLTNFKSALEFKCSRVRIPNGAPKNCCTIFSFIKFVLGRPTYKLLV